MHGSVYEVWGRHLCFRTYENLHNVNTHVQTLNHRFPQILPRKSSKEQPGTQSLIFNPTAQLCVLPVRSSRISTSVVFRSSRTRAGMPPQFFRAILLSSLAFPYTRFLKAPQALRWTSVIRWSNKSTRSWMPPCRRIWGQRQEQGIKGQQGKIQE